MTEITNNEKELVRMIQRGEAIVDITTGVVSSKWADESTGKRDFLGVLRRKLIPSKKFKVEEKYEPDRVVTMTPSNRIPELENRYNIHPGHIYRVIISGINPADNLTFDGVLNRIQLYADSRGFTPLEIELRDGLSFDGYSEKNPFDLKIVRKGDGRILGFGSIIDEEGFYRARERKRVEGLFT